MPIGPSFARKFSPEEQELRDLWNTQKFDKPLRTREGEELPIPEHPSIFRPDIPVNDSGLARTAESFYKIAPNLRNRPSRIMYGPGAPSGRILGYNDIPPDKFYDSTLLGATSTNDKEVNINPSLGLPTNSVYDKFPPEETLGHELTHAAGWFGEKDPERAEKLIKGLSPSFFR